jgi:hypothetical protein
VCVHQCRKAQVRLVQGSGAYGQTALAPQLSVGYLLLRTAMVSEPGRGAGSDAAHVGPAPAPLRSSS